MDDKYIMGISGCFLEPAFSEGKCRCIALHLALCLVFFSGLLPLPFAMAAPGEREVVVIGVGVHEDAAKRQAYRNAIQSVIGAIVVAETLVENDELMRDKVLSHSDGYISATRQVGNTRPIGDGLVEVTMRVTVKSDSLKAKLRDENISVSAFDGAVLFAEAIRQKEARDAAGREIRAIVSGAIPSVVRAEATIAEIQKKKLQGMMRLGLPVNTYVDTEAYATMVGRLNTALSGLGYERVQVNLPLSRDGTVFTADLQRRMGRKAVSAGGEELYLFGLCEFISLEEKTTRWSLYLLPRHIADAFSVPSALQVRVALTDANQAELAVQSFRLGGKGYANIIRGPLYAKTDGLSLFVAPRFNLFRQELFLEAEMNRSPQQRTVFFDVADAELHRVTGARCTLEAKE